MLLSTISFALLAITATSTLTYAQGISQDENPVPLLSKDESVHFEFLVALGEGIYGGSDLGPILGVAKDLESYSGNFTAWYYRWYELATQTKALAEDPRLAYDPVNVQNTWFSAATYFRRADFYNHGNWSDPRINESWRQQLAAFDKGISSLPVPGHRF
ncbi:hypothetical protein N0V90_013290 [Kalmusia sp. IMI 367209]|nr:hypothetical protein N0V90_013290 [Kalmusia sp. IMI 367209]